MMNDVFGGRGDGEGDGETESEREGEGRGEGGRKIIYNTGDPSLTCIVARSTINLTALPKISLHLVTCCPPRERPVSP